MSNNVDDLRSALEFLHGIPGQLVETDVEVDPEAELLDNNSYFALDAADSLIVTGPTGTNVNDITLILTDF